MLGHEKEMHRYVVLFENMPKKPHKMQKFPHCFSENERL